MTYEGLSSFPNVTPNPSVRNGLHELVVSPRWHTNQPSNEVLQQRRFMSFGIEVSSVLVRGQTGQELRAILIADLLHFQRLF